MIIGTTSGALLIATCPVPSIRCTSVCGRPSKTSVSLLRDEVVVGAVVDQHLRIMLLGKQISPVQLPETGA